MGKIKRITNKNQVVYPITVAEAVSVTDGTRRLPLYQKLDEVDDVLGEFVESDTETLVYPTTLRSGSYATENVTLNKRDLITLPIGYSISNSQGVIFTSKSGNTSYKIQSNGTYYFSRRTEGDITLEKTTYTIRAKSGINAYIGTNTFNDF